MKVQNDFANRISGLYQAIACAREFAGMRSTTVLLRLKKKSIGRLMKKTASIYFERKCMITRFRFG